MSKQMYPSNFDDSLFNEISNEFKQNLNKTELQKTDLKYQNLEFNKNTEDPCYIQHKDLGNDKKLKYRTTNFIDLSNAQESGNFFGMTLVNNVFVPTPDNIDTYSSLLNGQTGGKITNCNTRFGFGQLPALTTPYKGRVAHGPVDIEDTLRNNSSNTEIKKNSCLPKDTSFFERSFSIFNGIETPNAIKSVESPVDGFSLGRNGTPTRFSNKFKKINYKNIGPNGINYIEANQIFYTK